MRNRSLAGDHDAAVARRLELLASELASVRGGAPEHHAGIPAVPEPPEPRPDPGSTGVGAPGPTPPAVARPPGRHASRRARGVSDAVLPPLPGTLRDRISLGAGHVAVIAVVAVVGLAVTCWWLVRSGGHEVGAPLAISTPRGGLASPVAATDSAATPSSAASRVVVDVAGKVRRPGIAVLRSGARVVDAIRAAGGARPGVDLTGLNLAQVLTDGEQIVVGRTAIAAPAGGPAGGPASGAPVTDLVDLNTADETTLESLPEIGPVTAQAIIAWRSQHGGFSSVNQLLDVDGIGDATLAKLTPYVTI